LSATTDSELLLDESLVGHDEEWEADVVVRISRGLRALDEVSVYDAVKSQSVEGPHGWERVEDYAKDAIRTGAVYLDDYAIGRRLEDRERRKAGWVESRAERAKALAHAKEKAAALAEHRRIRKELSETRFKAQLARREQWRRRGVAHWKQLPAERQDKFYDEQRWILSRKWICSACRAPAGIKWRGDQYVLNCSACAKQGWSHHGELARLMTAAILPGPIKMSEAPGESLKED
jgi:hypothetical protein